MSILILAEHDHNALKPNTLNCVTCAQQLPGDITLLVVGDACQAVAEQAAAIVGVNKVILVQHACYQHFLAENMAELVASLADRYQYVLAPASTFGKNILPRVAALLDVAQISDITAVKDPTTFVRPIYAGNAFATVQSHDDKQVLTVRSSAFDSASTHAQLAPIETCEKVIESTNSEFIARELSESERPELTSARVIVSGGRGLQSGDNFKLLEQLADCFGAAIGASRAAVDAGFVPNDYQVGQTGKIVAPELYFAIGISGAIQHLAGMKDSKVIVAINKDEDAPIFQVADYGLVGDLFTFIPEIIEFMQNR
jgi:electron transfer flavoprotein alpha subunit